MSELKPCPFCGRKAAVVWMEFYWVECKKCKAETRGVHSRAAALELWNRRVGDDLMERMVDDGR